MSAPASDAVLLSGHLPFHKVKSLPAPEFVAEALPAIILPAHYRSVCADFRTDHAEVFCPAAVAKAPVSDQ